MALLITRGFGSTSGVTGGQLICPEDFVRVIVQRPIVRVLPEEQVIVLRIDDRLRIVLRIEDCPGGVLACKETISLHQGDTSTVLLIGGPADVDEPGWSCRLRVVTLEGVEAIATRDVPDTATVPGQDPEVFFQAFLTPTETGTLAPGDYTWVIELINTATTPPFNVEVHQPLCVTQQLIP